jgi:hypothetical protein
VRIFYEECGEAGVPASPPELAAVNIGFRTPHGQAISAVAALKKFGLVVVDETNERLIPSPLAIEILNLRENDPRRVQALARAALKPAIYRELAERYQDSSLPPEDILRSDLITVNRFNPNATKVFLRDFIDSLEFSELLSNNRIVLPKVSPRPGGIAADHAISPEPRRYLIDISIARNLKAELVISGGELRKEDLAPLRKRLGELLNNIGEAFEI